MIDLSNPESWEDVVELLVPELQRRGIYWEDYTVPGGTFRENMQGKPGQTLLPDDHPGAKVRWNAKPAPVPEPQSIISDKTVDPVVKAIVSVAVTA